MRPVLQRAARVAAGHREEVDDEGVARGDEVVLFQRPREAVAERLDDLLDPIYTSVTQQISGLGWVDIDSDVLPTLSCPAALPILPISNQPKQSGTDRGTTKIKVKDSKLLGHTVQSQFLF